jgi:uncharacterized protein YbaA (DUF1428 family)
MPNNQKEKAGYVDGFVIPVPKNKLNAYRKMARLGGELWKEYGALEYRECVGDDLNVKWGRLFPKLLRLKPSETIIFSWIAFKNKAHRNSVNAKVMKDPRLADMDEKTMPFDMKRMSYGGFKVIIDPF